MAKRKIVNNIKVESVKCEICGALHELSSKDYIKVIGFIGSGNYEKSLSEIPARICCNGVTCFGSLTDKMLEETDAANATKPKRARSKKASVVEQAAEQSNEEVSSET